MRNKILLTILVVHICTYFGHAQSDWIDRTSHKGLINIELSDDFETYATEENTKHLQKTINNLEQAKIYFDKVFDEDLKFAVLFIDNKNWNTYAFSPPPGMPQASHNGNIILGLHKSVMAISFEEALEQMPSQATQNLKTHFGDPINLDKFFRDGLALHELGHLYQFYKTSKKNQRFWLNELFGNLCQVAAAKSFKDQSTFNQMDSYQNLLIRGNQWGELKYKTLQQFENDYFNVIASGRNYGWYQTQFYLMAKELYTKYDDDIVKIFREFLIKYDGDSYGIVNDKELDKLLKESFGEDAVNILKWNYH